MRGVEFMNLSIIVFCAQLCTSWIIIMIDVKNRERAIDEMFEPVYAEL